jgi:hypothetical protein
MKRREIKDGLYKCNKCLIFKEPNEFSKKKTAFGGTTTRCKDCTKSYLAKWYEENQEWVQNYREENAEYIAAKSKEYRETHQEETKQRWQDWYKNNPERSPRRRFTEAKNKAIKKRKLSWTLTLEEYIELIKQPCYYCNYALGEPVRRACGLDRLNSSIGYEIDNVVSCCYLCNTIKGDRLTPEEAKIAIETILQMRGKKK